MRLREVTEADLPVLFAHQADPEASARAGFPPRDWAAFVAHWKTRVLGDPRTLNRAIVIDGGVVAGYVSSWPDDDRRLVGYWVGRAFWGRGLASAALAAFLASEELRRPLAAYVVASNLASIRVLEKCGFVRAGEVGAGPHAGDDGVAEWLYHLSA